MIMILTIKSITIHNFTVVDHDRNNDSTATINLYATKKNDNKNNHDYSKKWK